MNIRNAVDQPVKSGAGDIFDQACAFVSGTHHTDYLVSLLKGPDDPGKTFRGMLQICIHADHSVACAVIQTRDHGCLMSEISGKADKLYLLIL